VPCYNEASRLPFQELIAFANTGRGIHFIFVDDGSTDATRALLERLRGATPLIDVVRLERNSGKAEAVRRGILAALDKQVAFVGYWDADLSTPLAEIDEFLAVLAADPDLIAVLGSRVQRLGASIQRRPLRHYLGRVFATLASLVLRMPVYDTQCGAKIFRVSDELRRVFAEPFVGGWAFDVEILARLVGDRRERGLGAAGKIYEYPLRRWHHVGGSKLTFWQMGRGISDLGRIHRVYRGALRGQRS